MTRIPTAILITLAVVSLSAVGCSHHGPVGVAMSNDANTNTTIAPVADTMTGGGEKFGGTCHQYMMYHAALKLGLSTTRANQLMSWAAKPDAIDGEAIIPGTQQWKHGYVFTAGVHMWGNADYCLFNNINANNGTGYLGKDAQYYYYTMRDKVTGDHYLGYAMHYLCDVGNPWHTSSNIVSQLQSHQNYETWVYNNMSSGWKFSADFDAETTTISYGSYRDYVINLATYSYNNSSAMDAAFTASGKPTGAGTGNSTLVSLTRAQMKMTAKYMRGCIKKVMDQYGVW